MQTFSVKALQAENLRSRVPSKWLNQCKLSKKKMRILLFMLHMISNVFCIVYIRIMPAVRYFVAISSDSSQKEENSIANTNCIHFSGKYSSSEWESCAEYLMSNRVLVDMVVQCLLSDIDETN